MRKAIVCLCLLVLLAPAGLAASDPEKPAISPDELPGFIRNGMRAYKDVDADAGIAAWIKNGPLEGNKQVLGDASILTQAGQSLGKFETYDVVGAHDLTPRIRVWYLVLDYEKGPLYARFVLYRSNETWLVTDIDFNIHDQSILPPELE